MSHVGACCENCTPGYLTKFLGYEVCCHYELIDIEEDTE
jgi:hypothetical protein